MKASKFGAVSLTDPRHQFELRTPGFGSVLQYSILGVQPTAKVT